MPGVVRTAPQNIVSASSGQGQTASASEDQTLWSLPILKDEIVTASFMHLSTNFGGLLTKNGGLSFAGRPRASKSLNVRSPPQEEQLFQPRFKLFSEELLAATRDVIQGGVSVFVCLVVCKRLLHALFELAKPDINWSTYDGPAGSWQLAADC